MNSRYSNELYHFGIKGQKWGVRRYQNYDGTYTQTGLKRYRKTAENYEYSKNKYQQTKAAYKAGTATKLDVANAKRTMKEDKRTMNKYYKQLHKDKMGDKGKERYNRGERITRRGQIFGAISGGAGIASALLARTGNMELAGKLGYISAGSGAAYALINAYAELPMGSNAQLRAYYSHKSLPDVKERKGSAPKMSSPKSNSNGTLVVDGSKMTKKDVDRMIKGMSDKELEQFMVSMMRSSR